MISRLVGSRSVPLAFSLAFSLRNLRSCPKYAPIIRQFGVIGAERPDRSLSFSLCCPYEFTCPRGNVEGARPGDKTARRQKWRKLRAHARSRSRIKIIYTTFTGAAALFPSLSLFLSFFRVHRPPPARDSIFRAISPAEHSRQLSARASTNRVFHARINMSLAEREKEKETEKEREKSE